MADDYILPSDRRASRQSAPASNTPLPSDESGPPSLWSDVAKTVPSALAKGALGVLGLPGDIRHALDVATDYATKKVGAAARYATGRAPSWQAAEQQQEAAKAAFEARQRAAEVAHPAYHALRMAARATSVPPTSEQLVGAANKAIGAGTQAVTGKRYTMYDPQTAAGRLTQDVVGSIPAAMVGGEGLAANLAKNAPVAVTSGLGGGLAREFVGPESEYAPYAQLAGSVAGGITGGALQGWRNMRSPEAVGERADRIVGQAIREAPANPERDLGQLQQSLGNPQPLLQGVKPTTAQAAQSPALQALENRATQLGRAEGVESAGAAPAQREFSEQTTMGGEGVPGMVGSAIPKMDMEKEFGVSPDLQGDAAIRAKNLVGKAEDSLKEQEKAAWQDVDNQSEFYPAPMLKDINKHLDDMTMARAAGFPGKVSGVIRKMTDKFGATNPELSAPDAIEHIDDVAYRFDPSKKDWVETDTGAVADTHARQILNERWGHDVPPMPLAQAQDLRSNVLEQARDAWASGRKQAAADLYEVAGKIQQHLEDASNFTLGNEGASQAWSNAVDKSRQYNEAFGSGFAKSLTSTNALGEPTVAGEGTFARMFAGAPDVVQRLRQLREIPGVDPEALDNAASDWMLGKLTTNGSKTDITQDKLLSFMHDPKNAAIIKEVQPLQDRLGELVQTTGANDEHNRLRGVAEGFQKAFDSGRPKNLADFIDNNLDDLKAGMNPENHDFLTQLRNSARTVQKLPAGQLNSDKTIKALQNGTMLSLLYGKAAGVVSDSVAFEALSRAAQAVAHSTGLSHIGAAIGATASMVGEGGVRPAIDKALSRIVLGSTRQEAIERLQQAAANPELAAALAQKPSPEAAFKLADTLKGAGTLGTRIGAYNAARPEAKPPEEVTNPVPPTQMHDVLNPTFDVPSDADLAQMPGAGTDVLNPTFDVPSDADLAAQSREGRASGGAVKHKDVDKLVKHLMHKAKHARKMGTDHTETLLKHDDSTIIAALNAAKHAI